MGGPDESSWVKVLLISSGLYADCAPPPLLPAIIGSQVLCRERGTVDEWAVDGGGGLDSHPKPRQLLITFMAMTAIAANTFVRTPAATSFGPIQSWQNMQLRR